MRSCISRAGHKHLGLMLEPQPYVYRYFRPPMSVVSSSRSLLYRYPSSLSLSSSSLSLSQQSLSYCPPHNTYRRHSSMAEMSPKGWVNPKRLIVCCDGTWMNSDQGYVKPSIFNPVGKFQTPSNVTRIARSFRRLCSDGRVQIIEYQSGVGTGSSFSDIFTGGAFGRGVAENIRSAYSYICANYVDGDEIVLIGFSRGAFTARSVAGMIGDLGLLTRDGMEYYYPIFKDMENWRTKHYKDPFPDVPFADKPRGENAEELYRQKLLERGYTRVYQDRGKGPLIKVKAVAVWDTVGSLGIPRISLFDKLNIKTSTKEFNFYDTNLSDRIEHAFHVLALDEHRPPFRPTVWERKPDNKNATDLRQIWMPGNHGNIGGGWADQGISNISLAWMMDQLASVGVEFDEATIDRIFTHNKAFYQKEATQSLAERQSTKEDAVVNPAMESFFWGKARKWAMEPIYEQNAPVRPWAMHSIKDASGFFYKLAGRMIRQPGMYTRIDPQTGRAGKEWMLDTNERIHASVRIRLALSGLGLNDTKFWDAKALLGNWRLVTTAEPIRDHIPLGCREWGAHADGIACPEGAEEDLPEGEERPTSPGAENRKERWVWEYCGPEKDAPPDRMMVEDVMGPYERHLLKLSGGAVNVYKFAEGRTLDMSVISGQQGDPPAAS